MAKKWVVTILLVAFVRLQFTCCCGSFAICTLPTLNSESHNHVNGHLDGHQNGHLNCDGHDCHEHNAASHYQDIAKSPMVDDADSLRSMSVEANPACNFCHECCRHQHHLYLMKHGFVESSGKFSLDSIVVLQHYLCDSASYIGIGDSRFHSQSLVAENPILNLGVLEATGQLRI